MKINIKIGQMIILVALSALFFNCPDVIASSLGISAPKLHVKEWIRGEPLRIETGRSQNIIILEFWETTCPHCLKSMPFLEMLQDQYRNKGVKIIGITDEDPGEVKKFLKKDDTGKTVNYHIAIDDEDKTHDAYMKPFKVSGVPHVFVLDKFSRIVWVGHPLNGLDRVINDLITGRFDLKKARAAFKASKLFEPYMYLAIKTDEKVLTRQVGERFLQYSNDDELLLNRFAWQIANNEQIDTPDLDLAFQAIRRAYDISRGQAPPVIETYVQILHKMGKNEAAEAIRLTAPKAASSEKTKPSPSE